MLANATTGCSPITDVYNPSTTGSPTEWIFLSVQNSGKGGNCGSGGCVFSFINTPRLPSHVYAQGQAVLDSNFQVQVVATAGTSGSAAPTWSTTLGGATTDGTVQWFNQGGYNTSLSPWAANTSYAVGDEVIDAAGQVEQCTKAGISNGTAPSWTVGLGGKTAETGNGARWTNVGGAGSLERFLGGRCERDYPGQHCTCQPPSPEHHRFISRPRLIRVARRQAAPAVVPYRLHKQH